MSTQTPGRLQYRSSSSLFISAGNSTPLLPHLLLVLLVLLCFTAQLSAGQTRSAGPAAPQPAIREGVLDLSECEMRTLESISLTGDWLFAHRRFLDPERVPALWESADLSDETIALRVPGFWNHIRDDLPGNSYGTYVLKVILPPDAREMGIYMEGVHSAYALFANGRPVLSCGQPGRDRESHSARIMPRLSVFHTEKPALYLVLHTANYRTVRAGMMQAPLLGTPQDIYTRHNRETAVNLFLFGAIFIMALYYLGIHFFRRSDYTALFFALFCLFIALRGALTGARFLLQLLPEHSYELFTSIEFITAYVPALFFYLYYCHHYPNEEWRPFRYITYAVLGFLIVSAAVMPVRFHSPLFIIFEVYVVLEVGLVFGGVLTAALRRRPEAPVFLLGFVLLAAAIIQDIFYFNMITSSRSFMLEYGLFAFILTHAFTLARRYTRFEQQAKRYAASLEEQNSRLEQRYSEKSRQLEHTRHTLKTSQRRDFLTGLPNLKALEERYERLARRAGEEEPAEAPLALVSILPEALEEIEQENGRSKRDITLLRIAALLKEHCDNRAAVFRGESEEFLLLYAAASAEELPDRMREISRDIERTVCTVAVGAAMCRRPSGLSAEKLMERAREVRTTPLRDDVPKVILCPAESPASPGD